MTTENWKTAECTLRVLLATWDAILNEIEAVPQSTKEQNIGMFVVNIPFKTLLLNRLLIVIV